MMVEDGKERSGSWFLSYVQEQQTEPELTGIYGHHTSAFYTSAMEKTTYKIGCIPLTPQLYNTSPIACVLLIILVFSK
jgi:hypothetical protein